MAKKRKPTSKFGPKVTSGRAAAGASDDLYYLTNTQAVAKRVRAVKERLGLTWKDFEDRIGMSEKTRAHRTRGENPTPFTVREIAAICVALKARPEYLLLGSGPMILPPASRAKKTSAPKLLANVLYEHLVAMLQIRFAADRDAVTSRLSRPARLLVSIERGVGDAWESNFRRDVENRVRLAQAVREAVRDTRELPTPSPKEVARLVRKLTKGAPRLTPAVEADVARIDRESERENRAIGVASENARRALRGKKS